MAARKREFCDIFLVYVLFPSGKRKEKEKGSEEKTNNHKNSSKTPGN